MSQKNNDRGWYERTLGASAYTKVPVEAGAGYALGVGANHLMEPLLNLLTRGRPAPERAEIARKLREGRYRYALPVMMSLLAGARAYAAERPRTPRDRFEKYKRELAAFAGLTAKDASLDFEESRFDVGYKSFSIPKRELSLRIASDGFLGVGEKSIAGHVSAAAEERRGMTSGESLARSAMKAGAGFVPAYLFGRALGTIMGLPQPLRARAAMLGGIAGAVRTSGLVDSFKKEI